MFTYPFKFQLAKTPVRALGFFLTLLGLTTMHLSSCSSDNSNETESQATTAELSKLREENKALQEQLQTKSSSVSELVGALNDIENNLKAIKEKENVLSSQQIGAELQDNQKDLIVADIQYISNLIEENKNTIAGLRKKLKQAGVKSEQLEKLINALTSQIEQKDAEILNLKADLEKSNVEYKDLFAEYSQKVTEVQEGTEKLNTAFYAFGNSKELLTKGVITREGGFIGIGKMDKLRENFNKDYFTKIDIQNTLSIPLGAKKAKLLTSHPTSSYKWDGNASKIDRLIITQPNEFWSVSKYLVILIE